MNYEINDIVKMKKKHPCGSYEWEIIRTGVDFKIRCMGCSHIVMLSREKFLKSVKSNISKDMK